MRKVTWSSIPISWRISQCVVIHTVKGFGVVNKSEVHAFLELSCFFQWSSGCWQFDLWFPLIFLNPAWTSGSSQFTYCWSLAWRILSITFTSMWDECNYVAVQTFFGIAFLWGWNENWPFPVLWPLLSFPNLLAYNTFTASSFRIWNSSTGIPSHPLALFVVMLPKAHLTSHSRMSGSR